MNTTIRSTAIACGLVFLVLGFVWAYWIALVGILFGLIGAGLLTWVRRKERAESGAPSVAQARLHAIAWWIHIVAAATSLIALVITLLAN